MKFNYNSFIMLSSSCKISNGYKRSIVIDYDRGKIFFIAPEYSKLLERADRQKIKEVENEISSSSKNYFENFLNTMLRHEIIFLSLEPERYPRISQEDTIDDYIKLRNVIIEVSAEYFNKELFIKTCEELNNLRCEDFQIRLLSPLDISFMEELIEVINTTACAYIEIHCTHNENVAYSEIQKFIEAHKLVTNVYIYNSPRTKIEKITNDIPNHHPVELGSVYYFNYPFDSGNCCGMISFETLDYHDFYVHNQLKSRNGCLDRKLTIDRFGNIKNCPSMKAQYGNIKDVSIKDVIKTPEFQKYWFIHKDQINICKDCEFRYNCTDCRAFLQDPEDIYSKPLKCGYNPYTAEWEEWSTHPMKEKGITVT